MHENVRYANEQKSRILPSGGINSLLKYSTGEKVQYNLMLMSLNQQPGTYMMQILLNKLPYYTCTLTEKQLREVRCIKIRSNSSLVT